MKIATEVKNPTFTYKPAILKNAPADATKVEGGARPKQPRGQHLAGPVQTPLGHPRNAIACTCGP